MKLGREVSRHNELDNWRNTHRFESVMATTWLLLTISETEPGLWDRLIYAGFMDILPIARQLVIDSMTGGVIVLDAFGRVVDFNPAARWIVPDLTAAVLARIHRRTPMDGVRAAEGGG